MRMANGSQSFRRDQEEEAVPFLEGTNHDHPFAAEDVSLQRLHLLARRLAFPFARRIPRVTKRICGVHEPEGAQFAKETHDPLYMALDAKHSLQYTRMRSPDDASRRTAQLLVTIWLVWILAACIEWRAQHSLRRRRKQLVAFLQETTFYVVEEGRLSEGWRSPLQRRLEADAGELVLGPSVSDNGNDNGARETRRNLASVAHGRDVQEAEESDRFVRGPEDAWRRQRGLKSQDVPESHDSCPLIYTVDAKTAKKHGLVLFQEELELLGTVTARLCRCLCHAPIVDAQERSHQDPTLRRTTAVTSNSNSAEENAETGRPRRKLGVCEGEAHALMLEEMLKGANVVISGDSGWFYRWFENMQDAYERTCSHFSTRSTLGIPEGTVLRTVLTGTDMYEDSWFQLEGAAWRPFRHPIDAVRHGFNFMQYKLRQSQVGPLGKSTHTDLQPVMVAFDGCVSSNENRARHRGGRLLNVP